MFFFFCVPKPDSVLHFLVKPTECHPLRFACWLNSKRRIQGPLGGREWLLHGLETSQLGNSVSSTSGTKSLERSCTNLILDTMLYPSQCVVCKEVRYFHNGYTSKNRAEACLHISHSDLIISSSPVAND